MRFAKQFFGNSTPMMLRFQAGEAMANAGVPVLVGGAGEEGLVLASTTAAVNCVGVTVDTAATINTAQQTANADPASYINVIVDPNALYLARLSGSSTEGTALTQRDVTTASTDGLSVTTGDDWSSPTTDEGLIWGYDGANAGIIRKITSVSTSAATVVTAFPFDTVVGDNFLWAPFCASPVGAEDQFVQLTAAFYEVDCSVAVDTNNGNFRPIQIFARDKSQEGTTKSEVVLAIAAHYSLAA